MEPAPELLMPLLPYQRQFLSWAIACEKGEVRGGVLADEMVRVVLEYGVPWFYSLDLQMLEIVVGWF